MHRYSGIVVKCSNNCTALLLTEVSLISISRPPHPTLHWTVMMTSIWHCTTLHYAALHCTTLHWITLHVASAQPWTEVNCTDFSQMSLHYTDRKILNRGEERVCSDRWINRVWLYGGKARWWWVIKLVLGLPTFWWAHVSLISSTNTPLHRYRYNL